MAKHKTIPFLRSTKGLNVVSDPVRILFDPEKGVVDLATAYNVDVDDSGRISRRKGSTLEAAWNSRDMFCEGKDCLFVSGTALYRLNADKSRTGLRSGLTINTTMWYAQIGDRIYYSNGYEMGYAYNGLSWYWVAPTYVGPTTSRVFNDPPVGLTMLDYYKGRIYGAIGNILWFSEPYNNGSFDLSQNFIKFNSNIRFVKASFGPTDRDADGLFVGTEQGVEFLEGDEPGKFSREQVSDSVPIIGSAVRCEGAKIGDGSPGKVVIWTAQNGIWIGKANGQAANVTKDRLKYPTAHKCAAVYHEGKYIVFLQE